MKSSNSIPLELVRPVVDEVVSAIISGSNKQEFNAKDLGTNVTNQVNDRLQRELQTSHRGVSPRKIVAEALPSVMREKGYSTEWVPMGLNSGYAVYVKQSSQLST